MVGDVKFRLRVRSEDDKEEGLVLKGWEEKKSREEEMRRKGRRDLEAVRTNLDVRKESRGGEMSVQWRRERSQDAERKDGEQNHKNTLESMNDNKKKWRRRLSVKESVLGGR